MINRFRAALGALVFAVCFSIGAIAQDATSSNLQFILMGTGLHPNDWGTQTNANLQKIENAITGYTTVASGGGGTVTLTNDQARYASFKITGALTGGSVIMSHPRRAPCPC